MPRKKDLLSQDYREVVVNNKVNILLKEERNIIYYYLFEDGADEIYQRFPSEMDKTTFLALNSAISGRTLGNTFTALTVMVDHYIDFLEQKSVKKTKEGVAAVASRYDQALSTIIEDVIRVVASTDATHGSELLKRWRAVKK